MPFNLGFSEIAVLLVIVLLVFGAKRLPEIGGAMARSIREFKSGLKERDEPTTKKPDQEASHGD